MKAKTGMKVGVRFGRAISVLAGIASVSGLAMPAYGHDASSHEVPAASMPATSAPHSAMASAPAAASGADHAAAGHGKSTTLRGELRAKVLTIDAQSGSMVAKGDDGIERHFVLDADIRQAAAKFKAGDAVQVVFDRSVRVTLKPEGEKAKSGIAENGFDATVTAVNKAAKMISIQGPKGNVFDIDVERADVFERIKPNSVVHVDFGRPVARSVSPI